MTDPTSALGDGDPTDGRASLLQEVSNEMVRIYKELFGRGPTRSKTNWAGPDVLICSLEDSLTPAEKSLVKLGEYQQLRDVRMFFQHASEDDFTQVVEQITGRKVRAFVSGIDTKRDVSSEVFYLEPQVD